MSTIQKAEADSTVNDGVISSSNSTNTTTTVIVEQQTSNTSTQSMVEDQYKKLIDFDSITLQSSSSPNTNSESQGQSVINNSSRILDDTETTISSSTSTTTLSANNENCLCDNEQPTVPSTDTTITPAFSESDTKCVSDLKVLMIADSVEKTELVTGERPFESAEEPQSSNDDKFIPKFIPSKEERIEQCQQINETKSPTQSASGINGSPPLNLSQEYHLKWIKWKGTNKLPIVTQNSNGPCPLLAIMNVLLLRKNISFPPMIEIITAEQLMSYLCDFILSNVPTNLPEGVKLDYEQNFQDAMSNLPRLCTGLDVNVRFTGITDFEYTSECIIFDLLRIPLYHGWLVDPSDKDASRVVNTLSYNQLVDRIITYKSNIDPNISAEAYIAEDFLSISASQLTNYGLSQLIHHVKEDEICILFRNNHFITLYKYKGKLYQLVTDQGFLTESNMVWETLNNIEGDTQFVDGDFVLVPPKPSIALSTSTFTNTQQQIDQDYLIALSLEQEQKQEMERAGGETRTTPTDQTVISSTGKEVVRAAIGGETELMSDEEIARHLQAIENQYYAQMQRDQQSKQQQQPRQHQPTSQQRQPHSQASNQRHNSSSSNLRTASNTERYHHHQTTSSSSSLSRNQAFSSSNGSGSGGHYQPNRTTNNSRSSGNGSGTRPIQDNSDDNARSRSKNCSIM